MKMTSWKSGIYLLVNKIIHKHYTHKYIICIRRKHRNIHVHIAADLHGIAINLE